MMQLQCKESECNQIKSNQSDVGVKLKIEKCQREKKRTKKKKDFIFPA
jgi:hypothetical protein